MSFFPYRGLLERIADALEELVRLQRASLTGKYTPEVQTAVEDIPEEDDESEVIYHDDEVVAREEALVEKRQKLRDRGGRTA